MVSPLASSHLGLAIRLSTEYYLEKPQKKNYGQTVGKVKINFAGFIFFSQLHFLEDGPLEYAKGTT